MDGPLIHWIIYDHPADFPTTYVARRFEIWDPPKGIVHSNEAWTCDDPDILREVLEDMGLSRVPRSPGDEPQIMETWM